MKFHKPDKLMEEEKENNLWEITFLDAIANACDSLSEQIRTDKIMFHDQMRGLAMTDYELSRDIIRRGLLWIDGKIGIDEIS